VTERVLEHGIVFDPTEKRTSEEFRDAADINTVLGRWRGQGIPAPVSGLQPVYGDFTDVGDYLTAVNRVKAAEDAFMQLPARLRQRVGNDPGRFLEYALDPVNRDELVNLGLAEPPVRVASPAARVAESPPPAAPPEPGSGEGEPPQTN